MSTPIRTITTTEIANLAGVSTAAVSQWRKRHSETFPQPIPGKGRAVLFDRAAVLNWLKDNDRPVKKSWGMTDDIRGVVDPSQYGLTLTTFAARATVNSPNNLPSPLREQMEKLLARPGVEATYSKLADQHSPQDMLAAADLTFVESGWENGQYSTPKVLNDFIVDLVPESPHAVLDFACGNGGTLEAIHKRFPETSLSGNDINSAAMAVAQARAIVNNWSATWTNHDAIQPNAVPDASFDLVCSAPPFGVAVNKDRLEEQPERWPYGVPGRNDDIKWLQLAHHALTDGGIGIINTYNGPLITSRAGSALPAMVADGSILAVISLPENLFDNTAVPSALIVFTKNPTSVSETVLFATVQAANYDQLTRKVTDLNTDDLFAVYADHLDGKKIPTSDAAVQVPRLELVGSDKPLLPTYWVTKAHPPKAEQFRDAVTTSGAAIKPLKAVEDELDGITLSDDKTSRTIPASKLPGIKRIPRPKEEDLVVGDICIGPTNTEVCTVDGQRPSAGLTQVLQCDSSAVDPWFLAGIIDAFQRSGIISTNQHQSHVDLRLIDVPNINIAEQRTLGETIKTLRQRRQQAEEQAERWSDLEKAVSDAIAAGITITN
ncbi:N-6 DNA methylase [Corynebacterium casei]|uniref:N-6 DNA methylase n=1 Tax=Corynebacterium casei TaxID=160386 RepID=UPI003FCFAF8A